MKTFRLLFSAATGVLAATAAQAADLPVAPEPIDYVRVCDAFGAGFYYIPGTDTCLRVGGRVRVEYRYFDSDYVNHWRDYNSSVFFARGYIRMDSRTNTEFGLLRAYNEIRVTVTDTGSTGTDLYHSFIQFGGFTFGKTQSFYDFVEYATWASVFYPAVSDERVLLGAYTFAFGNGVSSSLSLESNENRRSGIDNYSYGYGGTKYPDVVANLRVDQGWGSAQIMGALHQVYAAYNPAGVTPSSELGFAVGAGVVFDLPVFSGLKANLTGTYSRGAVLYASSSPDGPITAYDAVLNPGTNDLELSSVWSVSGGVIADWTPTLSSALQAGYLSYQNDAVAGLDYTQWSVQGNLVWSPVAGFVLGPEIEYQYYDASSASGVSDGYDLVGLFRVQRTF